MVQVELPYRHVLVGKDNHLANDNIGVLHNDIKVRCGCCRCPDFGGLSSALHLSKLGYNVTIVDAHEPGWGASGRNGGQVIPGLKIQPDEIIRRYGAEQGERIVQTASEAPSLVYSLIEEHGIDCDLKQTGWIQLAKGPKGEETTNSHIAQWGSRGVDVKQLSRSDIEEKVGTSAYASGLLDARGGNLHPLKYARGLAIACINNGVSVYRDSPAYAVERSGSGWLVKTENGSISAQIVIICTNAYTGDMLPRIVRFQLYRCLTGVMATGPLPDALQQKILPERQGVADTRRASVLVRDRFCQQADFWQQDKIPRLNRYTLKTSRLASAGCTKYCPKRPISNLSTCGREGLP